MLMVMLSKGDSMKTIKVKGAKIEYVSLPLDEEVEVYKVSREDLPQNQYILVCREALEVHTKPWLCAEELHELAKQIAVKFLKVAYYLVPLNEVTLNRICELTILSGGLYYMLDEAFKEVFGRSLQRCLISAKRYQLKNGSWRALINYENFEALPDNAIVLIGDTIATGSTIVNSLKKLRDAVISKGYTLDKVIILTISGAVDGSRRLKEIENEFKEIWGNFELYVFNCCAIFGLAPNGTDMPYGHPETIAPPHVMEYVNKVLTRELAEKLCSIFDWGDRTKHPIKHLRELIELCEKLKNEVNNERSLKVLDYIINNAKRELEKRIEKLNLKK